MKCTRQIFLRFSLLLFLGSGVCLPVIMAQTPAPGCPNVSVSSTDPRVQVIQNDTAFLKCEEVCVNLDASFLQTGSTNSYSVSSIPYAPPFPFAGGTPLFVGSDDVFSGVINLPFDFCFFGSVYNRIVVGANGCVSFDVGLAGGSCCWSFDEAIPTPNDPACPVVGAGGGIYGNSINGAFHDMDPSVTGDINYSVLGTAPCRTFVVNFRNVAHFDCNSLRTTQQIVIYETTNAIEVYIKDKPACAGWNNGNAAIGIQNAAGTVGYTPPGRNTSRWTANNEAWRFTPNGAPNYVISWKDDNGNTLGSGSTQNVCLTAPFDPEEITVEIEYTNCNGVKITDSDAIVVSPKPAMVLDKTEADALCYDSCNGSATISVVSGGAAPYTATWPFGPGNLVENDLCAGNYNVTIEDANGCTEVISINIDQPSFYIAIPDSASTSCYGDNDGMASVQVSGGTPPYAYMWSGGDTTSGVTDGGGLYSVVVEDANGCLLNTVISIPEPDPLLADTFLTNLSCPEAMDGQITAVVSGGTSPYDYDLDGTGYQGSSSYMNLSEGSHALTIRDKNNCTLVLPFTLTADSVRAVAPDDITICEGQSVTLQSAGYGTQFSWNQDITDGASFAPAAGAHEYILTATNKGGCTDTDTVIVTVKPQADPTIQPAGPFCTTADPVQLVAADPDGTWSGPGVDANGIFDPGVSGTGSHTITYAFGGPCPVSDQITVSVNNSFNAAIDPVQDVCELDDPFEITSVTPGGLWYGPGMDGSPDSSSAFFNPGFAGPGEHRVYHLIEGSCGDLDSVDIKVIPAVIGKIDPLPDLCPMGAAVQLTATPANGTWKGQGVSPDGWFDPATVGSGTYQLIYEPASNCALSDTQNIWVVDTLKAVPDTTYLLCHGDMDASLNTVVTGGKQPYQFQWPVGVNSSSASASNLGGGDYPVDISDQTGCTITALNFVGEPADLVFDQPYIAVNDPCYQSCQGSVRFFVKGGTVAGNYNFALSPSGGTFNNADGFTGLCEDNYTATITDDNGCAITQPFSITHPQEIRVQGTPKSASCNQANGAVIIDQVQGGTVQGGQYDYLWSNGATTRNLLNVFPGQYDLTVTDDNQCSKVELFMVPNTGGADLNMLFDSVRCAGGSDGRAIVQATGGIQPYSYSWDAGGIDDTLSGVTAGTYQVSVFDATGCESIGQVTVEEPLPVVLEAIPDSTLCDGQVYQYNFQLSGGNGGAYWVEVNGIPQPGTQYSTQQAGNKTVVGYDRYNCTSDMASFDVVYLDPVEVDILPFETPCPGDTIVLEAIATGGLNTYSFSWNNGSQNGNPIDWITNEVGTQEQIQVVANDGCSLSDTLYFTIDFHSLNALQATFTPASGCEPLDVVFDLEDEGYSNVLWKTGDGNTIEAAKTFVYTYENDGVYSVDIQAISADGCLLKKRWNDIITVYPDPTGEIFQSPANITVLNREGVFRIGGAQNVGSVEWYLFSNNGDSLAFGLSSPWLYRFPEDTATYLLRARLTSPFGCSVMRERWIRVKEDTRFYVPSAFSPNNDGINDVFRAEMYGVPVARFEIMIFDRWGELVFSSTDPDFVWDGSYRGNLVEPGVYAWKIRYYDGVPQKTALSGMVTVVR